MVCTVSFGVTGYSLPWDQVGYWAVKIVTGVPDAIPVIGPTVVELLRVVVLVLINTYSFLQFTHFCFTFINCCIYVNALLNDCKQGFR
jgi:quinol-cytochrome oxidoreductase complex cytochrome b subunit